MKYEFMITRIQKTEENDFRSRTVDKMKKTERLEKSQTLTHYAFHYSNEKLSQGERE